MTHLRFVALVCFSAALALRAQDSQGKDSGGQPAATAAQQLDALFSRLHATDRFDGVVLVAEAGETVFEAQFGLADAAAGLPLVPESVFGYASIGKPIMATTVLRLVERGLVELDAPVARYLEEFPYPKVTVRQLLTHTSGLLNHLVMFERYRDRIARHEDGKPLPITNLDVVRFLASAKPETQSEPGATWDYNNINYIVLGHLVGTVAGAPIGAAVRREVFEPAGMKTACALPEYTLAGKQPPGLAVAYVQGDNGEWLPADTAPGWEFVTELAGTIGDGGIGGSARDLLAFDRALAGGKLLGPAMLRAAVTPAKLADGSSVRNENWVVTSYGLGWTLAEDGRSVWHTGDWGGYLTWFKRYLDTDRTVIYLMNRRRQDWSWLAELEAIVGREASLRE